MAKNYWLDIDGNWGNTANWSLAAVPVNGDDVYILSGAQNIASGLAQSAVTLSSLTIGMGFTGTIGTTSAYLAIGATNWTIGVPQNSATSATGSGRIKIDFGAVQYTGLVLGTSSSTTDTGLEPVRIKGSHASNKISVTGGRVGVGTTTAAETATVLQADVGGGVLNFGYGVTWTTVNISQGGTFLTQSAGGTTLTTSPGATTTVYGLTGSSGITTVNAGGTTNLNHRPGSGNVVGTLNLYATGTADFSGNPGSGTLGTFNHYKGGVLKTAPSNPNHITGTITRIGGGTLTLS